MRISIATVLLAFSAAASAQNWQSLGKNDIVGGEILVDTSSLTASRSLVTGKMLINLDAAQPVRTNPTVALRSVVLTEAADCAANTVGVVQETNYTDLNARGAAVFSSRPTPSPRMVPLAAYPASIPFFRYACDHRAQATGNGPKASDFSAGAALLTKDPPALSADEEVIARMSWAAVEDARAKNQDPVAALGNSQGQEPLRNCIPRSKTLDQFRACYRVARVQAAIANYDKVDAPGVEAAPPPPVTEMRAGGVSGAATGAVAKITDAEWAAYEVSQAASCGTDGDKCVAERNEFLYSHWPAPNATAEELAQPCRNNRDFWADDNVRKYANSGDIQQRGGPLLAHWLANWAGEHFPNRAFDHRGPSAGWCSDGRFQIVQWQRAVGLPQTGKISNADVDDFVNRWAPVIMRLNQSSQVQNTKLEAARKARNDEQAALVAAANERDQKFTDEAYANGPTAFGIRFGRPWQESIPACQLKMDGINNYQAVVDRTCFVETNSTLYFASADRPAWVGSTTRIVLEKTPRAVEVSTIQVELDQSRVVGMKFPGQKPAAMSSELDRRFGSHDTQENEVSIPGKRVCTGAGQFIQCVDVPPSKRTEIFYKWAKDGLVVSTSDVNTASFDVSVTYEAYAKVKAYRAEAAALKQQPKPPVSQPNTGRGF